MAELGRLEAATRFSAAQLQVMSAMGLVPWIQRGITASEGVPVGAPSSPVVAAVTPVSKRPVVVEPLDLMARPVQMLKPASGLARVLVLVDRVSDSEVGSAWGVDQARLLSLMLQSIHVRDDEYALATLAGRADTIGAGRTVRDLVEPGLAAVLLLSHDIEPRQPVDECRSVLAANGRELAGFQVHHPDILLQQPAEKRLAWETLKQLRVVLGGVAATPSARQ